ncbi:sugar ABC transporter substrate-binding protein [Labrenzia sp. PHM005]|uniref:sugar ABC transporter substrate-binding protein n=1 Tax=Labrenzia sp. PHM005 TaxID=2590016 RepID=UPI001140110F|nr:sugar ABC transporter substrate-binding protein [Labrenzia sp. PHM005]QDG75386.1 sugar ABC transporter substrate-binding protein [Labrenzia sp. PHM005]
MKTNSKILSATLALSMSASVAWSAAYKDPVPMKDGSQASIADLKNDGDLRIAYMPPATEFNYYIAIGEGIKAAAESEDIEVFMLAPQSGADINGQMGMIQDVITQDVDAIILSTHDEAAAAPLVSRAVEKGIAVVIVNSDIADFPTPVHGVVGYSQREGTRQIGKYLSEMSGGSPLKVGVIEGQPGYHSTERVGGFLDGIETSKNIEVVASIAGGWNVEGGNIAGMDLLQANPDVDVLFAANDYMIMGAALASKALGKSDLILLGNDGDTAALEEISNGKIKATVNTLPFIMGEIALEVTLDTLKGEFPGGFVQTSTMITDETNVLDLLQDPDSLYPKPSKEY